ncbi:MAG: CRISPR-associated protein Csx20 [Arcobacteraceae bacterium]
MFLFFSHELTNAQILDAKENWRVKEFISLPQELQEQWSNIPSGIENLTSYLTAHKQFLAQHTQFEDMVLIQGDFGAVYNIVNFAKELGLKPVYATTNRIIEEFEEEGKTIKKSIFEHVRFREYV